LAGHAPILIHRGGHRPWGSYQLNAGNRCADRRFRSSRPTVGARVMRSIGAMVRVLDILEVVRSLSRAPGPLGRHARLPGRGAPEPGARTPPLPCPGCRLPDQIASLQQRRNRLALNWCGFLIAETRERPEQLGTQPQGGRGGGVLGWIWRHRGAPATGPIYTPNSPFLELDVYKMLEPGPHRTRTAMRAARSRSGRSRPPGIGPAGLRHPSEPPQPQKRGRADRSCEPAAAGHHRGRACPGRCSESDAKLPVNSCGVGQVTTARLSPR
jgi:hypothetical protein